MLTIGLFFTWPMGHRILGLEGAGAKCENIHGHNWTATIEFNNDDGALEFGAVKSVIDTWIDHHLDHGFMCAEDDPFLTYLQDNGLKYAIVPEGGKPTTESIATLFAQACMVLLDVTPTYVCIAEGPRNHATWRPA